MALADRMSPAFHGGAPCKTCVVLDGLNADDAATLRSWLADPDISRDRIARALREDGHDVSPGSIWRHRRGHR